MLAMARPPVGKCKVLASVDGQTGRAAASSCSPWWTPPPWRPARPSCDRPAPRPRARRAHQRARRARARARADQRGDLAHPGHVGRVDHARAPASASGASRATTRRPATWARWPRGVASSRRAWARTSWTSSSSPPSRRTLCRPRRPSWPTSRRYARRRLRRAGRLHRLRLRPGHRHRLRVGRHLQERAGAGRRGAQQDAGLGGPRHLRAVRRRRRRGTGAAHGQRQYLQLRPRQRRQRRRRPAGARGRLAPARHAQDGETTTPTPCR